MKRMLMLLIVSLLLSGCWDRRELNELAITMALGVDKVDDKYKVSAQVVVPSELSMQGGTGSSPVTLYQAEGETVAEAISRLTAVSPRHIYPGHLQIVIIGDALAKEGISSLIDRLSRNWEVRSDFFLAVAKESTAEKILNVQTSLESIPAIDLYSTLDTSQSHLSTTSAVTLTELINNFDAEGKQGVLTGVEVLGEESKGSSKENVASITPPAYIKFEELAIFKGDKLIGWLSEEDSVGYNGITNQIKSASAYIDCPKGGKVNINISHNQAEVKSKIVNESPNIDINISVIGSLDEVDCSIDLNKMETIRMLEKLFEKNVKARVDKTINIVQEDLKSDIFGFGSDIYRQHPKEWEKLKENWDETFVTVPVKVHVKMTIKHFGAVINPIKKTIKE